MIKRYNLSSDKREEFFAKKLKVFEGGVNTFLQSSHVYKSINPLNKLKNLWNPNNLLENEIEKRTPKFDLN